MFVRILLLAFSVVLTLGYVSPPPLDRVAYDILHGMGSGKDPFDSLRQHEKESYLSDIETSRNLADMADSLFSFEDKISFSFFLSPSLPLPPHSVLIDIK